MFGCRDCDGRTRRGERGHHGARLLGGRARCTHLLLGPRRGTGVVAGPVVERCRVVGVEAVELVGGRGCVQRGVLGVPLRDERAQFVEPAARHHAGARGGEVGEAGRARFRVGPLGGVLVGAAYLGQLAEREREPVRGGGLRAQDLPPGVYRLVTVGRRAQLGVEVGKCRLAPGSRRDGSGELCLGGPLRLVQGAGLRLEQRRRGGEPVDLGARLLGGADPYRQLRGLGTQLRGVGTGGAGGQLGPAYLQRRDRGHRGVSRLLGAQSFGECRRHRGGVDRAGDRRRGSGVLDAAAHRARPALGEGAGELGGHVRQPGLGEAQVVIRGRDVVRHRPFAGRDGRVVALRQLG